MADTQTTTTTTTTASTPTPPQEVKAKTPLWKRVLVWAGGIASSILAVVIGVFFFWRRKKPPVATQSASQTSAEATKAVEKNDSSAKEEIKQIEVKQEAEMHKLEEIKAMPDEDKALKELQDLVKKREEEIKDGQNG